MATEVKWAAKLSHVREVALRGSADLLYWRNRLVDDELEPAENAGRAALLIVGAVGRFMGIRFRELSISVEVAPQLHAPRCATYFLVRAFNSNRVFAFCERVLFSTPYDHAQVAMNHVVPAEVQIARHGRAALHAKMYGNVGSAPRTPTRIANESSEACVLLPKTPRGGGRAGKMFFARLEGRTQTFPFAAGADAFSVCALSAGDVFSDLIDSGFVPEQWAIREDATHAKSITYQRCAFGPECVFQPTLRAEESPQAPAIDVRRR